MAVQSGDIYRAVDGLRDLAAQAFVSYESEDDLEALTAELHVLEDRARQVRCAVKLVIDALGDLP